MTAAADRPSGMANRETPSRVPSEEFWPSVSRLPLFAKAWATLSTLGDAAGGAMAATGNGLLAGVKPAAPLPCGEGTADARCEEREAIAKRRQICDCMLTKE